MMASEYIKYLTKDEKKAEAPPPLSPKERRKNWFYYHKWHLIIGGILIIIALDLLRGALHIGEVMPDVQIAYVGTRVLPDDLLAAASSELSALCPDANGDGRSVVQINSYPFPETVAGDDTILTLRNSSQVRLMAGLEECSSFLLLVDDPAAFEEAYHILAQKNGEPPVTEADSVKNPENYTFRWEESPALSALTAEDGAMSQASGADPDILSYLNQLAIGRRIQTEERSVRYPEACEAFWNAIAPTD